MNLAELYKELKVLEIDDSQIYLHGLYGSKDDNDKLALLIKMGKHRPVWEIYHKERGQIGSVRKFFDEDSACQYYLRRAKFK